MRRNSSGQFARCVKAVKRSGSAYDPNAVCAASERRRGLINKKRNPSDAYKAGFASLRAGEARYGTVNLSPSISQREEWRHDWGQFMAGWRAAQKQKENPIPLFLAEAGETQILTPYQKQAQKEATKLQKRLGLKFNKKRRRKSARTPEELAQVKRQEEYTRKLFPHGVEYGIPKTRRKHNAGVYQEERPEWLWPKAKPKKRAKKKNPSRRNPEQTARDAYEGFHGRASEQMVTITTPIHEHRYLSALGDLEELSIISQNGYMVSVKGFEVNGKPALLCQNEAHTQLFIEGGDQRVDLADFGIKEPIHESEVLGECDSLKYFTTKDHLGSEGGEAVYKHKLRSFRFRRKPTMIYDTVNGLISFSGGNYSIPNEGIEN